MVGTIKKFIQNIPFLFWLLWNRLSLKQVENVAKEYVNSLVMPRQKTAKKHFIGLIGSYGVGKTTVAKKIAEKLPFIIIVSDEGRRLLERKGFPHNIIKKSKLIFLLGLRIIKELMNHDINIILDADLREPYFREPLRNIIASAGYNFILLHVMAPENLVRERITERRTKETSRYLKDNLERHYEERRKIHLSYPLPDDIFYTFANNEPIDAQIEEFIDKFKKQDQ